MAIYVSIIDGMDNATAGDLTALLTDFLLQEGVVDLAGGDFLVEENDTPDMNVKVAAGVAYVENDAFTAAASIEKFWRVVMDLEDTLAISSNSSGSTRVDLICIHVDDSIDPGDDGESAPELIVVEGTPGAGAPATPDDHLVLAQVTVANGASSITNANISDQRQAAKLDGNKLELPDDIEVDTVTAKTTNGDLELAGDGTGLVKADASYGDIESDSDGATITFNMAVSNKHTVTLGDNRTLAVSNVKTGQVFMIKLVQDGTGGHTVTWFSNLKWPSGSEPTLSTDPNAIDTFIFIKTGASEYLGFELGLDMQTP